MMVGSVPTFIVVWITTYLFLKPLVTAYQGRRIARRRRKLKRERDAKARAEAETPEVATLPVREEASFAESPPVNRKTSA
jgi:hypothetical protein